MLYRIDLVPCNVLLLLVLCVVSLLKRQLCGAVMVLLSDDVPIWGGMVTQSPRGSGNTIEMSLATIESYLDRRYVGDVVYTQVGQNYIVASLIAAFVMRGWGWRRPGSS